MTAAPVKPRDVPWARQLSAITAGLLQRKRLTDAELWAEHDRTAWVIALHGPFIYGAQLATLQRFIARPHAGDSEYL